MELAKSASVGVSYNLFDGEELLEASIRSIRDKVKYINVVYQTVSNYGNPANADLENLLNRLVSLGLIDELFLFSPVPNVPPKLNEILKRDIGLSLVKQNNCDYFLSMDVDEFYDGTEFENALNYIVENDIMTSAVSIIEYIKSPEYQFYCMHSFTSNSDKIFNYYVPFLIKIDKTIEQQHGRMYFPCFVDPTRKLACPGRFKVFSAHEIAMHHMCGIRKDLIKKYKNSSDASVATKSLDDLELMKKNIIDFDFDNYPKISDDIIFYGNRLVRKIENKFKISF